MPRVVCLRRFALRGELTESNAISELLFDVTFAVSLQPLQLLWPLRGWPGPSVVFDFLGLFLSRYGLSWHMAVYSNRFENEEFADNIVKGVLMLGFVLIARSSATCSGEACQSVLRSDGSDKGVIHAYGVLCAATALCHLVIMCMYLRGCWHSQAARFCRVYACSNLVLALIWAVSSSVGPDGDGRSLMLGLVVACLLATEVIVRAPSLYLPTTQPAHLSVRMRKFQVVSITQVFAGLTQPRLSYSAGTLLFAAGAVCDVLAVKILFFDFEGVHRSDKGFVNPQWLSEFLWVALHMVLAASVTLFGTACSSTVRVIDATLGPDGSQEISQELSEALAASLWLFCEASVLLIICLTALSLVLKGVGSGKRRIRKRYRLLFRLVIAISIMLTPLAFSSAGALESLSWSWVVLALLAVLIAAEMYGRTHRKHLGLREAGDEARALDEAAEEETALSNPPAMPSPFSSSSPSYGSFQRDDEGERGRRERASSITSEASSIYMFE